MTRYALNRIAWGIPIILGIVLANFVIVHLVPGDPVLALIGDFPAPPEYIEKVRRDFGLDQPLQTQLVLYIANLFQGDLGFSFTNRQQVLPLILTHARFTLLLMVPALILASVVGVILAMIAAPRVGGGTDSSITAFTLVGHSVPVFWLAQILIIAFAIELEWLPAQGMSDLREEHEGWAAVLDTLRHLVLPTATITLYYLAVVARVARVSVLNTMSQDFVLTAKAKGMSRRYVMWRHVLPNAIIPVVTVIGYNFGSSLTGAILVETVFAWPGIGSLFLSSIAARDYPVMQGIFFLAAITVVVANLVTDLLYALLDPRIRRGYGKSHA
jgi:peptide/nickel transport system permease protein